MVYRLLPHRLYTHQSHIKMKQSEEGVPPPGPKGPSPSFVYCLMSSLSSSLLRQKSLPLFVSVIGHCYDPAESVLRHTVNDLPFSNLMLPLQASSYPLSNDILQHGLFLFPVWKWLFKTSLHSPWNHTRNYQSKATFAHWGGWVNDKGLQSSWWDRSESLGWVLSLVSTLLPLLSFYHVRSVCYLKIMTKTSLFFENMLRWYNLS